MLSLKGFAAIIVMLFTQFLKSLGSIYGTWCNGIWCPCCGCWACWTFYSHKICSV